MWTHGDEGAHLPELIAAFDVVSRVTPARLVLLTASPDELRRRYERQPDQFFSPDVNLKANARFPSLLPLLPRTRPALHIDTTAVSPDEAVAQVDAFISP